MNKIEHNGEVAVLFSPGYGAGWSTWNDEYREVLCMDAEIVQAVLDGDNNKAIEIAENKCPGVYTGGGHALKVAWVHKGKAFEITEYDGYESITIVDEQVYMVA